ncbi:hypothetical protein MRX60_12570 (plasmid) [Xylella fastidiosa subsp. pauca]|uniref:hypothetical protein n=1 Tax=Xylella fastidiosa TaxID=2371 RepID=UPI00241FC8E6|nr:hypothetical protein [Xylella fastidiosa]MDG5826868.1 hypothetical protein [Xylella fastidiosa subsp. pauca]
MATAEVAQHYRHVHRPQVLSTCSLLRHCHDVPFPHPCPDRRVLRRGVVASCLVARRLAGRSLPSRRCCDAKTRDDTRRQILQSELATEKKAYDDANGALSTAISGKQPADKIDALKQSVLGHQKNVEAIKSSLPISTEQQAGRKRRR